MFLDKNQLEHHLARTLFYLHTQQQQQTIVLMYIILLSLNVIETE